MAGEMREDAFRAAEESGFHHAIGRPREKKSKIKPSGQAGWNIIEVTFRRLEHNFRKCGFDGKWWRGRVLQVRPVCNVMVGEEGACKRNHPETTWLADV